MGTNGSGRVRLKGCAWIKPDNFRLALTKWRGDSVKRIVKSDCRRELKRGKGLIY